MQSTLNKKEKDKIIFENSHFMKTKDRLFKKTITLLLLKIL
jgi:hypothetical protein